MKEAKDIFNQEITAGDIILYTVSHSGGSMTTRLAIVDRIVDNEIQGNYQYELKVRAYDDNHFVWNYDKHGILIDYTIVQRLRRTTLTSNQTIVKLNTFTLPEGFKRLLTASVV